MTALKYWDGTNWVIIPDNSAKQIWTGPDAPVPLGDNRLWIDTDESDPTLVGSNSWHSQNYAPATASLAGWRLTPIPTDVNFIKNGDTAAFVRNADGSLTVRDAGVYDITASISSVTGGGALIVKGVDESIPNVNLYLTQSGSAGNLIQLAWVGYLPAGQVVSLMSYLAAAGARQTLNFSIARILAGPQGPPGPPGPYMGVPLGQGRVMGIEAIASGTMATSTDYPIDGKADGTQPIRLGPITPTYDCWWPVEGMLLTHPNEAAWNGCNVDIWLTDNAWQNRADVDGVQKLTHRVFHYWGLPADWVSGSPKGMFKLAAGQTYGAKLAARPTQGTWVYYRGGMQHTWISSSGIVPR